MSDEVTRDQLTRYLTGACTPDEEEQVLDWLERNGTARLELEGVPVDRTEVDLRRDPERALQQIMARAEKTSSLRLVVSARRRTTFYPGVAAGIALLVAVAILYTRNPAPSVPLAAEGVTTYVTRPGEQKVVHLADGSTIRLGVDSRLRVARSQTERIVRLDGEAFFDVARDEAHPFVIRTGNAEVRVLGTAFGVEAYSDRREVAVVVTRGRVALRSVRRAASPAVLTPGMKGMLAGRDVQVRVSRVDTSAALAWREGRLVYAGVPLSRVADDLERWYGVEVVFSDAALATLRLDGTFNRQPLTTVLDAMAVALDVEYRLEGRRVTITRP